MMRLATATLLVMVGATTIASGQKRPVAPSTKHVELDAAVVDNNGHPVRGLRANDFEVREDGESVAIDRLSEVASLGLADDPVGRSLVLLLHDTLVRPTNTPIVQSIARLFLSRVRSGDSVAVVRLTQRDPAVGPLEAAIERVNEYRAGRLPYFGIESIQDLLDTVARVSKAVSATPARRTAVVCIGGRPLCDPYFARPDYSLARTQWRNALVEAARANVAVYFVDPAGLTGRGFDLGYGLVEHTGGIAFVDSNQFDRAVDAIWDEASHYYFLDYTSVTRSRELHSVQVKVTRPNLHVHARLARGD